MLSWRSRTEPQTRRSRYRMEVRHGSQGAFNSHPGYSGARSLRRAIQSARQRRFKQRSPASALQLVTGESDKPAGYGHRQRGDNHGESNGRPAGVAVASPGPREVLFWHIANSKHCLLFCRNRRKADINTPRRRSISADVAPDTGGGGPSEAASQPVGGACKKYSRGLRIFQPRSRQEIFGIGYSEISNLSYSLEYLSWAQPGSGKPSGPV